MSVKCTICFGDTLASVNQSPEDKARWAQGRRLARERYRAETPAWKRTSTTVFVWTVGLVVGLLILGFLVAALNSWNPVGGG